MWTRELRLQRLDSIEEEKASGTIPFLAFFAATALSAKMYSSFLERNMMVLSPLGIKDQKRSGTLEGITWASKSVRLFSW